MEPFVKDFVRFFAPEHLLAVGLLSLILTFIGSRFVAKGSPTFRACLFTAAVALLAYAAAAIICFHPDSAEGYLGVTIRAVFCAWLALSLAFLLLPMLGYLHRHLIAEPAERYRTEARAAEQRRREERLRREQERQLAAARAAYRPVPPPPVIDREAELRAQHAKKLERIRSLDIDADTKTAMTNHANDELAIELMKLD